MKTRHNSDQIARVLRALGDATRLRVIAFLAGGERCVCELVDHLEVAQSLLSFHLKTLKDAGLLTDRREGRWVFYALDREALAEAEEFLRETRLSESALRILPQRCRD